MNTLYLHIGSPKTGTSAFQSFMYANQNTLAANGITYFNELIPPGHANHWMIARRLWKYSKSRDTGYVQDLVNQIAASSYSVGFLSAEALTFWIKWPEGFTHFVEECRAHSIVCRVVAVVRSPLDYLVSAYSEDVTAGNFPFLIDDWVLSLQGVGHRNVIRNIRRWEDLIPAQNFHWIRYEQEMDFPQKILKYVLGDIDYAFNQSEHRPSEVRKSMNGTMIEIFRRMNALILPGYDVSAPTPKNIGIYHFIKDNLSSRLAPSDDFRCFDMEEKTVVLLEQLLSEIWADYRKIPFINATAGKDSAVGGEAIKSKLYKKLSYDPIAVEAELKKLKGLFWKQKLSWFFHTKLGMPYRGKYGDLFRTIQG